MRISHLAAVGAAAAAIALVVAALPASADGPQAAAGPLRADRAKGRSLRAPRFQGQAHGLHPQRTELGGSRLGHRLRQGTGKRTVAFSQHAGYHGAEFALAPSEREPDFRNVGEPDGSLTFH